VFYLRHIGRREAVMALLTSLVSRPTSARDIAGNSPALLIAVPEFVGVSADEREKGRDLALVIASDLRDSGGFMLLDPSRYAGIVVDPDTVPKFGDWRALSADCLVIGRLSLQSDGRVKVEFRLWEVVAGQSLYAAQYFVAKDEWHRVPHIIAASIFKQLTGQAGRFDEEKK
jgi:TolB protein